MKRFAHYHLVTVIAVVLLLPVVIEAQTRGLSVTMTGAVSETVNLSIQPNLAPGNIHINSVSSGSTVRMTFSGDDAESSDIRVPLIVRSNCVFRISTAVESKTALLTELSVVDARATGTLVSPEAISWLEVTEQLDLRRVEEKFLSAASSSLLASSLLTLSGPRVSLGGPIDSPHNALQITFLIRVKPQAGRGWVVNLTFAATAGNIALPS